MTSGSCDCSYHSPTKPVSASIFFRQRGNYSDRLRKLNTSIPTLEDLELPDILRKHLPRRKPASSWSPAPPAAANPPRWPPCSTRSTSTQAGHIVTLEDPVEFVHPHQDATFNQRELGTDFDTFPSGLRAALRQAPKVILVGEMRDRETVEIALSAAETGHLVLSTLHTIDAGQTINRILGMFEPDEQEQIRLRLADTLRWVVSQRLVPRIGGGRQLLLEIMGPNLRTQETIRLGETRARAFTKSSRPAQPLAGRPSTTPCSKPTRPNSSPRTRPISTRPRRASSPAPSTSSRSRAGANWTKPRACASMPWPPPAVNLPTPPRHERT